MADAQFRTEITAERAQFDAQMDGAAQKSLSTAQRMQSAFREASVNVGNAVRASTESLNSHFDAIVAGVAKLRGALSAVLAIVGGGALFGKYVSAAAQAAAETQKLARLLGTTTEEASALRIALGMVGSDTDTYVAALQKMTMKLREGEARFNELGVVTRGTNGELLNGEEIMQNGLKAMLDFKSGTDRNLASTELFGRGWGEVNKLMRLTPQEMEKARVKAEELQLAIGPQGAARALEYRRAVQEVKDVAEALGNRIAQAVMPILTDLGQWLAEIGPAAVTVMRVAIGGLGAAFYGWKIIIETVWEAVKLVVRSMTVSFLTFAEVVDKALKFDFAGAKDAWARGSEQLRDTVRASLQTMDADIEKSRQRIIQLFNLAKEQGASGAAATGGRSYSGKDSGTGADKSRVSQFETELAALRDALAREADLRGSFQEMSKQQESDFWLMILTVRKLSDEEKLSVLKKYYEAERAVRKEAFEGQIAELKVQIEAQKAGAQERIRLAEEIARRMGIAHGLESKEYRQAQGEVDKVRREAFERAKQLQEIELDSYKAYQLQRVSLERTNLDTLEKLGLISGNEKLARLKELKEIEFQIEVKSATERAALLQNDVVAYRKALEEIEAIKRKHAVDMAQIDGQILEQQKKDIDKLVDPVTSATEKMATGIIMGTQRFGDAVRRALLNIGTEYLALGVKVAANWVKTELLKTQATVTGVGVRTAAETTGAATSILTTAGTAIKSIGAKAWEAAASVYASIAEIPVVGPFLAPAMAIAAAATVLGFIGRIASASGGFDIPSGMSPMTQLHEEEMVLPKDIANPLRENLADGAGGATHYHISAMDARSFEVFLRNNRGGLQRVLQTMHREFMKPR